MLCDNSKYQKIYRIFDTCEIFDLFAILRKFGSLNANKKCLNYSL
jgi:hypothetical protein